jgi:hypothetical protein
MKAIKSQTPYGNFPSLTELIRKIQEDPIEFILKYQQHFGKYPWTDWYKTHNGGTGNTLTGHFIYSIVRNELLDKEPGWVIIP